MLEGVPVARHEVTVVSVDVGERAKAVVFHLEEPIRMVEGLREPQERHGPECPSRVEADLEPRSAGGHRSIVPAPPTHSNWTAGCS